MNKSKAKIDINGTALSIIYGKNALNISGSELNRLKDDYTPKDVFITRAEAMCEDFLQMEGYDWDYDSRELQRKLAIIYDNLKKK